MPAGPDVRLPQSWSALDLGLHAFLALSPLALGLWTFSLAPLVGGNLLLAVPLAGAVAVLGAVTFGSLAARWPWAGGDYAWQTRFLDPRLGAILALASWWLVVALLAPVYGNVAVVQVLDPIAVHAGWDGLASWFRGRDGGFAASLIAIALAAAFVVVGMRRAAIVQRIVVAVGGVTLLAVLVLLLTSDHFEYEDAFNERASDIYGTGKHTYGHMLYIGTHGAHADDVAIGDSLRLVALVLLFALWIGWATPLVGEVRAPKRDSARRALVRAASASTLVSVVFLVAVARGMGWEFWNEANSLYWGTVYETTATTLLPTWPSPVVLASWITDSTAVQIALVAGMAAWIVGWTCTLFLAATRVLLAAAVDGVLPRAVARTTGDSVPAVALALLVVPACALAAADAYSDAFARWSAAAVVALAVTVAGSGVAAVAAFRHESRGLAALSGVFAGTVVLVVAVWVVDPVFGIRTAGPLLFLGAIYAVATSLLLWPRGDEPAAATGRHLLD